jgi:predicted acyl esterase
VQVFWEVQAAGDDLENATPGWTTGHASWPPPGLEWSTLYLTAAGGLSSVKPDASPDQGMRGYLYPLGTELVGSSEQFALAPHPLGSLSYRTDPAPVDTMVLGSPQLTFYFSCEQNDTDFMCTLKDIDPDGNALFLQRTVLRASMRAPDQVESTRHEILQSFTQKNELVPGEINEVMLSLSTLGHVLRKDHQLELSILAPNAMPSPIWGFAPVSLPSLNKVFHSAAYPSRLLLPVMPREMAKAPAPRFGALQNQPVRLAASSAPRA